MALFYIVLASHCGGARVQSHAGTCQFRDIKFIMGMTLVKFLHSTVVGQGRVNETVVPYSIMSAW
jgi:hypothetical protein